MKGLARQYPRPLAGAVRLAAPLGAAALPVAGAVIGFGAAKVPLAAAGVVLLAFLGYRLELKRRSEERLLRRRHRQLRRRLDQCEEALTQAQVTVVESERQLIGGIDHLVEAMIIADAEGVIRHANPTANRMFGYQYGELSGRSISALRLTGTKDAGAWLQTRGGVQRDLLADPSRETVTARHRSGSSVSLEVAVTPTRYDGEPRYCLILQDVTQRRSMERQLRQHRRFQHRIIELMPVAVFIKDARRLVFNEVDGAFEQFLGVPRSDIVGRRYHHIPHFPAPLARRFEAAERRMADGALTRLSYHDVVETAHGERTVRASMVPVTDDGGTVTHLLGVVENLTDEVAAQRALSEQKQQAEHYLRLAQTESGRRLACFRPLDVGALIRDVEDTVRPLMSRNGNLLEITGEIDGACVSDDDLLRRILINLLGNAAKFTSDGRVSLRYRIGPDQAWFQVRDTGIGIAPDAQRRIFEPFAQGDASIARIYGGTGLGLTLCQRFCRQLGGRLVLDSRPGEGAIFTLTVPSANRLDGPGAAGTGTSGVA